MPSSRYPSDGPPEPGIDATELQLLGALGHSLADDAAHHAADDATPDHAQQGQDVCPCPPVSPATRRRQCRSTRPKATPIQPHS